MYMKRKKRRPKTDASVVIRMSIGLLLIVIGSILALGAAGFAGVAGGNAFHYTFGLLGVESLILPIIIIGAGVAVMMKQLLISPRTGAGLLIMLLAALAFFGATIPFLGGTFGVWIGGQLTTLFGFAGTLVLLVAGIIIGLALATDIIVL